MPANKNIVLITGANSGIGYELVTALSRISENYHILLGSRSIDRGKAACDQLQSSSASPPKGTVSPIQIDVTDEASILAAKQEVETKHGRLDVLVNNAGIIVTRDCDKLTNMRETFETNVFGAAIVTDTFEPLLQKSADPRVIYVSSDQGSIATRLDPSNITHRFPGYIYRMSKSALNMLAMCHRVNFASWGCKVCAFNPGFCVTNLTGEAGRAQRIASGARDPKEAADALVRVIMGERGADFEKSGIIDVDGDMLPW